MAADDGLPGVSNCYVFKSRLQEYAQKVKLPTPTYDTIRKGPSHEPLFRSTVTVGNIRYDSLPGFFSRKAAEQSAAEVALVTLANSGAMDECIYQPVHDMGLCKNLLQEYSQKMNYAIPLYECQKVENSGLSVHGQFFCTVDIGGIMYIGAAARSKKEAELKAARTALLAIQSDPSLASKKLNASSMYTVLPTKKKVSDLGISSQETVAALKPKKGLKKKQRKRRLRGKKVRDKSTRDNLDSKVEGQVPEANKCDADDAQVPCSPIQLTETGLSSFQVVDSGVPPFHVTDPGLPPIQATDSGLPLVQVTGSGLPPVQATDYGLPPVQVTDSGLPPVQATSSGVDPVQVTNSGRPPVQVTDTAFPPIETINDERMKVNGIDELESGEVVMCSEELESGEVVMCSEDLESGELVMSSNDLESGELVLCGGGDL